MRILAIDPGEKRLGIALSDDVGMFARPLQVLHHTSREKDAAYIIQISDEYQCQMIIIGQALDSDGQVGYRARSSQRLADSIKSKTNCKVILWDESYSSHDVHELDILSRRPRKNRNKDVDARAAAIILDDYLKSEEFQQVMKEFNDIP